VQANFRQTTVVASGSIADHEKIQGKTVLLDLAVPRGRVDDLLRLFVHDPQPGMVGSLTCRAAAVLPPEDRRFIEKLRLHGDFAIARARFTSPNTQASLNKLSGRAEEDGKKDPDPPVALFDVHGRLALAEGVAGFSQSWFALPDVSGALGGTYNLVNERINLNGVLLLPITLSQTTTGIKSVILKFVDPFLKRKHHRGDKVPFKITGTYGHASVGLDLGRHHSL
jgi:hypothetical protein